MGQRFRVTLEKEERQSLDQLLSKGKADVRRLKHAQMTLLGTHSCRLCSKTPEETFPGALLVPQKSCVTTVVF
jgi:hypothetical protein